MWAAFVIVSVCGLARGLELSQFHCCGFKSLVPKLNVADDANEDLLDKECLMQRSQIAVWSEENVTEMSGSFVEHNLDRYVSDVLKTGEQMYWYADNASVVNPQKRIAGLIVDTPPNFTEEWSVFKNDTALPTYVCQNDVDYRIEHMFDTLSGQNGRLVILATSEVKVEWDAWLTSVNNLRNVEVCGSGCLIGVGEYTGRALYDVMKTMESSELVPDLECVCDNTDTVSTTVGVSTVEVSTVGVSTVEVSTVGVSDKGDEVSLKNDQTSTSTPHTECADCENQFSSSTHGEDDDTSAAASDVELVLATALSFVSTAALVVLGGVWPPIVGA